jgi:hypothetical protein
METNTKVNISLAPWQECECGGLLFTTKTMVKRLSALMSPDAKEHMIPIEVHICDKCGKVPGFIGKEIPGLPEDLKAIKPIV